jgi:hypothetical protein
MHRLVLAVIVGSFVSAAVACDDDPPAAPSQPQLNLTGTWTGDVVVQGATARMIWTLTHTGNTVSGPVVVTLPSGLVLLNGALSGTLSGSQLMYTITVPSGGIPSQPGCTGQLGGSGSATNTTLTGSYNVVTSTCTTPFSSGTFTLTKTG